MTVQHDESLVTAAHEVHDEVWAVHWKKGHTDLRSSEVVEYVREVRIKAGCTEERLPRELQLLVQEAREGRNDGSKVKLSRLIQPLNRIIHPAA